MTVLLRTVAEASEVVAGSSGRRVVAGLFSSADPDLLPTVVGLISGAPRQGRVGIGWASVADVDVPAAAQSLLSVEDLGEFLDTFPGISGPASQSR